MGNDSRVDWAEGPQEFEQPLRFMVVQAVRLNRFQKRFCIGLQRRQLIGQGRVENDIGILLIRVNILFFATAHIAPYFQRRFRTAGPELMVPHHAADNARISRGNPVMVIDTDLRQGA